ncbi:hypothetical protein GCM10027160_00890 [Streptomyces calidiresistens]
MTEGWREGKALELCFSRGGDGLRKVYPTIHVLPEGNDRGSRAPIVTRDHPYAVDCEA